MGRAQKIWILSLVTFGLLYLAFTNRYIVFPELKIKYDRWSGNIYRVWTVEGREMQKKKKLAEFTTQELESFLDLVSKEQGDKKKIVEALLRSLPDKEIKKGTIVFAIDSLNKELNDSYYRAQLHLEMLKKMERIDTLSTIADHIYERVENKKSQKETTEIKKQDDTLKKNLNK